ncbi:MAG: hypothetical protein ACKVI5_02415, partial [Nitrospinaceae bacterium]
MTEFVEFSTFVTKGLTVSTGDQRRIFKGHITAEIIDKQQEFIFVKEVMKIMEAFMDVNPVISDYHSNRMVGKVLSYEKSEYKGVATVLITGEVYKREGITLYDKIWDKVVKGEYSGLSMGGASKEREPIQKDGKMALELRKLELYEIALCDTPANPFAVIESVNKFAKANGLDSMVKDFNGREQIRCTSVGCKFEKFDVDTFMGKSDGEDINVDVDVDNHQYKCEGGEECDICGLSKAEHHYEEFDKPEEVEKLDSKVIVNRSAETRAETVGESTGSPKETNDVVNSIPKVPSVQVKSIPLQRLTKDHIPSVNESVEQDARNKQDKINGKEITKDQPIGDINAKGEFPLKPRQSPNTMTDSNGNVNKFEAPPSLSGAKKQSKIEGNMTHETSERRVKDLTKVETPVELIMKFGVSIVKEALE